MVAILSHKYQLLRRSLYFVDQSEVGYTHSSEQRALFIMRAHERVRRRWGSANVPTEVIRRERANQSRLIPYMFDDGCRFRYMLYNRCFSIIIYEHSKYCPEWSSIWR